MARPGRRFTEPTSYRAADTATLRNLVTGQVEGGGRWTLHVSDNLRRDVGRLNAWKIDLRGAVA